MVLFFEGWRGWVDIFGRVGRCCARLKTMNPEPNDVKNQPEILEQGEPPGGFGHIPIQRSFGQ